ncbi:MAG: amidohydrolase [Cytophagales bacterium]|nr:amidohydrolase [Armatimonadota bacterium]
MSVTPAPPETPDPAFLNRLRAEVRAALPQVIALRHDLHAHPELSGGEERTAGVVSGLLSQAGIVHETRIGGTHGIVAVVESGEGASGPTFALRGDMDALPITEENEVAYKSQNPGVMHACGHDGHTANLLGAALALQAVRQTLPPGRVKLIFQPAEETVRGADAMIEAGAIKEVDAILMLHGWPHLPPGQIGVRNGPAMASSDTFKVVIKGKGGHGAYPHDTFDPILCGAQVVTALQTLVSREIPPVSPAVVSVTMFHAGTARNIIPSTAEVCGTVRTLDPQLRKTMAERVERVIAGICAALRCGYDFAYTYGTPVTVNDARISNLVRVVGSEVLGSENVIELPEPTMGAEDFAYYVEKIPGAMFRLGTGCPFLLHTPKYDFGDAPLETGILLMAETARRFLAQGGLRPD